MKNKINSNESRTDSPIQLSSHDSSWQCDGQYKREGIVIPRKPMPTSREIGIRFGRRSLWILDSHHGSGTTDWFGGQDKNSRRQGGTKLNRFVQT